MLWMKTVVLKRMNVLGTSCKTLELMVKSRDPSQNFHSRLGATENGFVFINILAKLLFWHLHWNLWQKFMLYGEVVFVYIYLCILHMAVIIFWHCTNLLVSITCPFPFVSLLQDQNGTRIRKVCIACSPASFLNCLWAEDPMPTWIVEATVVFCKHSSMAQYSEKSPLVS